jgi:hypothetical protein
MGAPATDYGPVITFSGIRPVEIAPAGAGVGTRVSDCARLALGVFVLVAGSLLPLRAMVRPLSCWSDISLCLQRDSSAKARR